MRTKKTVNIDILVIVLMILLGIVCFSIYNTINISKEYENHYSVAKAGKEVILGGQIVCAVNGVYVQEVYREDIELETGDIISYINGQLITDVSKYMKVMEKNIDYITVEYLRNNKTFTTRISYDLENEFGFEVTNLANSVFVATFYDLDNNKFVGCGHESNAISSDTILYLTNMATIKKSNKCKIGDYTIFSTNTVLASKIYQNSKGVYGELFNSQILDGYRKIEISDKNSIRKGEASIYCSLEGQEAKEYKIQITMVKGICKSRYFKFKVIDEELLEKSGGLLKGMSGSPIVQDGRLIGAVSSVLKSNCKKGYAVYITDMDYITESMD